MSKEPMIGWVVSVAVTDIGLSSGPVTMAWAVAAPLPDEALAILKATSGAGDGPFSVLCMLSERATADLGLALGDARPI